MENETELETARPVNQTKRFDLTDDEWTTLVKFRPFDDNHLARSRINSACVSYCLAVDAGLGKLKAQDINLAIDKIATALEALRPVAARLKEINTLKQHTNAFNKIYWAKGTTFLYEVKDKHFEKLDEITTLLLACRDEMPEVKRGSKENLLVEQLVLEVQVQLYFLRDKKERISRSNNGPAIVGEKSARQTDLDFFQKLFEILGTKVGSIVTKGTIDGAMERAIAFFKANPESANVMKELGQAKGKGPEAVDQFFSGFGIGSEKTENEASD